MLSLVYKLTRPTPTGKLKLESDRKNINEEAQDLNIGGKSTNNPQTIINAFNEYFLSLVEKKCVDDYDNGNDSSSNRDNNDNTYIPIYYLLNAFYNSFPNIKLKSTTTQEIKNSIKKLKPKYTYGYDEIPNNLLKISLVYISSTLYHMCNTSLSS